MGEEKEKIKPQPHIEAEMKSTQMNKGAWYLHLKNLIEQREKEGKKIILVSV